VPKLRDDGAHGKELATILHPERFTEWWYFNVRDPKTGLSFLFMYDVTSFGRLRPRMAARQRAGPARPRSTGRSVDGPGPHRRPRG